MTSKLDLPRVAHDPLSARVGFWAALLTALLTATAFAFAIRAIPISGPNCPGDCVAYPFADVAHKVPGDYIWMYVAVLHTLTYIVMMVALADVLRARRHIFAQIALAFATMGAVSIIADYYIQIAVAQPSIVQGEFEGFALLTQYNAHGVFIALEDMGYFLKAVAFFFVALPFAGGRGLERAIFLVLSTGGAIGVLAWFVMYAIYGFTLEYRYEVLALSVDWLLLIVGGALLALWFRRMTTCTLQMQSVLPPQMA